MLTWLVSNIIHQMSMIRGLELLMKKTHLLILSAVLAVSACTQPLRGTVAPTSKTESVDIATPEIGVIAEAPLGELISERKKYTTTTSSAKGIRVLEGVSKTNIAARWSIEAGTYYEAKRDGNFAYYTADTGKMTSQSFSMDNMRRNLKTNEFCIADGVGQYYAGCFSQVNFQEEDVQKSASSTIGSKVSLMYLGKSGNVLKFSYREFTADNLAKPAFTTEVTYDLDESNIIGYKSFKAEIIEATNSYLKYKVISHFDL